MKRPQGDDLLKRAGWSSGDDVWMPVGNSGINGSTSSSTYAVYRNGEVTAPIGFGLVFPGGVQPRLVASLRHETGGTGMNFRLRNTTDSETIAEETGRTSMPTTLGPTDYTPTTADPVPIELQIASNDNTTSLTLFNAAWYIGFQL